MRVLHSLHRCYEDDGLSLLKERKTNHRRWASCGPSRSCRRHPSAPTRSEGSGTQPIPSRPKVRGAPAHQAGRWAASGMRELTTSTSTRRQ
ncbi:hypothetical protein C1I93_02710 [Micromonospora endophytica]|uniref:Uncharacterized protein n=1 Tax=Micromonospora endophytica TaxID=515350 RepID=A0A2W2CP89_9ACTN|nr:hypothetical protein C1I93_02710 [Micromonospora endophytica]RIW47732.1 hypothetical protein D3H59_09515 [Micromonospora endophytica]